MWFLALLDRISSSTFACRHRCGFVKEREEYAGTVAEQEPVCRASLSPSQPGTRSARRGLPPQGQARGFPTWLKYRAKLHHPDVHNPPLDLKEIQRHSRLPVGKRCRPLDRPLFFPPAEPARRRLRSSSRHLKPNDHCVSTGGDPTRSSDRFSFQGPRQSVLGRR